VDICTPVPVYALIREFQIRTYPSRVCARFFMYGVLEQGMLQHYTVHSTKHDNAYATNPRGSLDSLGENYTVDSKT